MITSNYSHATDCIVFKEFILPRGKDRIRIPYAVNGSIYGPGLMIDTDDGNINALSCLLTRRDEEIRILLKENYDLREQITILKLQAENDYCV